MGMYTELLLKCSIKPEAVNNPILRFLFAGGPEPDREDIPHHPLFMCDRWKHIGSCSSHYHHPKAMSDINENGYLFSRSDLKNYDDEINKFLDWFWPFVEESPGQCIGWTWYEEEDVPTLIIYELRSHNHEQKDK